MVILQMSAISLNLLSSVAGIVTSIISIVLTVMLVWLYRQQQLILKRQTELAESNHKALPRIRIYHLFSWLDLYKYEMNSDKNFDMPGYPDCFATFSAYISNAGNGFAKDMRAELVIKSRSKVYSTTDVLAHRTNVDQLSFNMEGGVLSPEEGEALMVSEFSFPADCLSEEIEESGITVDNTISPSELLWALDRLNESPIKIAIFIHYKDGSGVRDPIQLLTSQYNLSPYTDIRTAYEWGGPVEGDVESQFNYS